MHARLRALRVRHDILESRIHGEMLRPRPDDLRLSLLKRMKLKLRDEIAGIETAISLKADAGRNLELRAGWLAQVPGSRQDT